MPSATERNEDHADHKRGRKKKFRIASRPSDKKGRDLNIMHGSVRGILNSLLSPEKKTAASPPQAHSSPGMEGRAVALGHVLIRKEKGKDGLLPFTLREGEKGGEHRKFDFSSPVQQLPPKVRQKRKKERSPLSYLGRRKKKMPAKNNEDR